MILQHLRAYLRSMELSTELGDLEDLIRGICYRFGVSEKDFMADWRMGVRALWDNSSVKRTFHDTRFTLVENTNPKSLKRFPQIKRWECSMCKGLFEKSQTEIDHVLGENSCKTFKDAAEFLHSIALPRSPEDLQILCKDCHSVKTYAERYKYSIDEARVRKEHIQIKKSAIKVEKALKSLGVIELPKSNAKRVALLLELMLKDIGVSSE